MVWLGRSDARATLFLISLLQGAHAACEVGNVFISTFRGQVLESRVEIQEVVLVEATRTLAHEDVLGKLLRVLRANKLLVVRSTDIDERTDGGGAIGRLEWRIVNGVAVDLANVQIVLDFGDLFRLYAVGDAPDLFRRGVVMVGEIFPVRAFYEGDDASGGRGSTTVILTLMKCQLWFKCWCSVIDYLAWGMLAMTKEWWFFIDLPARIGEHIHLRIQGFAGLEFDVSRTVCDRCEPTAVPK